ncbi:MAG: hypothetical protein RLZZ262_1005 [Bacteroidota bacterium]|jgi:hypothetical protein
MMRFSLFFITLLFCSVGFGQSVQLFEERIAAYHGDLAAANNDDARQVACDSMVVNFRKLMVLPEAMNYPFEAFKFCKLKSSDGRLRIFNWNLPYEDGSHIYYGFVLVKDKKDKPHWWVELKDAVKDQDKMENRLLPQDRWLGALYYEIIPMSKKNCDTYTLLGWDGKDKLTTRKIIEVLHIQNNKVRFGENVFKGAENVRKRMLLEYSEEVSASVKYYEKEKCILFDHLSPKSPMMAGVYSEYGPDGTYDLLVMKKGKWEFQENVDISKFVQRDSKPFIDPRSGKRQ